jgi:uncharacterized protein
LTDLLRRLGAFLASLRPVPLIGTLALGTLGGALFAWLQLPLPWMLGAMSAVTVAALLRLPVHAPDRVRPPMVMVIGVLLGAGFKPSLLDDIVLWLPTLAGLLVFTVISGGLCWLYLVKVAGFDRLTGYFAAMPGGLVEMIEVGGKRGGDETAIALVHSARILMVVFSVPFLVQWTEGVSIGARPAVGVHVWEAPWPVWAELVACAVVGSWLGRLLRLPAHQLLGPMLVSAALHVAGLSTFTPPIEVVQTAQVVLGSVLGARFLSTGRGRVLRLLLVSAGMTAVLLAVTVAMAWAVAAATGLPVLTMILAYSPGGLAEMSLVALVVHADVALIATHHLVRVLIVMVAAGPVFSLLDRLRRR